jgi:hypothetical protein
VRGTLLQFRRESADLSPADRLRTQQIDLALSSGLERFRDLGIARREAFEFFVDDEADLSGLSWQKVLQSRFDTEQFVSVLWCGRISRCAPPRLAVDLSWTGRAASARDAISLGTQMAGFP